MIHSKAAAFHMRQARTRALAAAPLPAEQSAIARLVQMGYRNVAALGSALAAPFRPSDDDMLEEALIRARRLSYGGTDE